MGRSVVVALVSAMLLASCGPTLGQVKPTGQSAFSTQYYVPPIYTSAWGPFGNPYGWGGWGFPYYVPPIYTPNLGNPFAPPPLAAGPWINPIYGTVNYSVGFPWAAGWNGIPAF